MLSLLLESFSHYYCYYFYNYCCFYSLRVFTLCWILTSDPAKYAIPKTAEVACSIGVGELGWQYGTGLKSHSTVTNWCTGREWPVNCITVFFRSMTTKHAILKMAEVAHSVGHLWDEIEWALNYYITQCIGNSMSLEIREMEKWCCRENSTQQRAGPRGLRLSNPGEREKYTALSGGAGEVNMLQSLFGLQLPLTHNPFK